MPAARKTRITATGWTHCDIPSGSRSSMSSYLIRHWRGELPLAAAWWLNCLGLTGAVLLLELNAGRFGLAQTISTRSGFSVYLGAGVALFLLLPAWQVIGTFRAADRHAAAVGTVLAARLTQVFTTLLTILLATRFLVFAGEMAAGARLAYSLGGPGYTVTVTHDGRVLEISGGFLFGIADAARQALAANPAVRRVRLNSGGGSLTEARRLRALILARDLDTDSTTGCASACVSAYIGGHNRLLRSSARLGFHLPRNPGFGLRGRLTPEYAAELSYFAQRGVPRWFLERWVATGREFWYPTPRQLAVARLVHTFYGRPQPGEEMYFF